MKAVVALLLLAGCALPPPDLRSCADAPAIPAPLRRVHTREQGAAFAIRLELAREAERARGDDCADRLRRLNEWIKR